MCLVSITCKIAMWLDGCHPSPCGEEVWPGIGEDGTWLPDLFQSYFEPHILGFNPSKC